jgi:phosphatidylglycerophosphate synthase
VTKDTTPPPVRLIGESPVPVWGLSGRERLERMLRNLGATGLAAWPAEPVVSGRVVLLRADYVVEENLLRELLDTPDSLLADPETGIVVAGHVSHEAAAEFASLLERDTDVARATSAPGISPVRVISVPDSAYNEALRSRFVPFVKRITPATRDDIQRRLFASSYKGVTDVVTKHVWPRPAYHATRACVAMGLSPNMVTSASGVFVLIALWLFADGMFGLGLAAGWAMTFLDTVDGKLARVTLTSSPFGNVFDHGIDLVHPPFWYWAWIVGLHAAGMSLWQADLIAAVVIGGYVVQRLQEGAFLQLFGMHLHVWRRFDSFFRQITARRNPNLLILTFFTLFARPDIGMMVVALWTAVSFVVHSVQLAQAIAMRLRGKALSSWLAS